MAFPFKMQKQKRDQQQTNKHKQLEKNTLPSPFLTTALASPSSNLRMKYKTHRESLFVYPWHLYNK
jgi:hypothetical protein